MSNKTRAVEEWDLSDPSEKVDWYSEYIARHAQLSASWLTPADGNYQDIRGLAVFEDSGEKKAVGPLEDGSLGVWDLDQENGGPSRQLRMGKRAARSSQGILFSDSSANSESSQSGAKRALAFSGVADCVSVDAARQRAYVAVGDLLNEVDLNALRLVSQTKYAWSITALSDVQSPHQPLSVGTTFSLHLLDSRTPSRPGSCSPIETTGPGDSVAFFPNKDLERIGHPAGRYHFPPFGGFGITGLDQQPGTHSQTSNPYIPDRPILSSFAPLEPSPSSIVHQTNHAIMCAGRFPSILNYDRRFFPRLEYVIHSSARLSALAYLPFSPRGVKAPPTAERQGTLISCGEYNGRGSLELYSVPHSGAEFSPVDHSSNSTSTFLDDSTPFYDSLSPSSSTSAAIPPQPDIYSYKNRQTVSSSKLLSVASHGTRIVFSDADGGLKWVERDGRSVVRRWNINSYQLQREAFPRLGGGSSVGGSGGRTASGQGRFTASVHGEEVVRKIIPTGKGEADDLLVWTGEKVGLVSFGRKEVEEEWSDALEDAMGTQGADGLIRVQSEEGRERGGGQMEEKAHEYDQQMRRALERQADELNWMTRFGFRSSP
jgi:hypothetical protein